MTSFILKCIGIFIGLFVFLAWITNTKTLPEPTQQELIDRHTGNQAYACLAQVRRTAREPDSVEMVSYGRNSQNQVVITYRGRNGFGGMSVETRVC